jgi:H+/Cl- antiporter ClcA
MKTRRPIPANGSTQSTRSPILRWPSTRLGWWSVGLAATYALLSIYNSVALLQPSLGEPWRQVVLPFYSILFMLCGLAAGVVGLVALLRQHERSWLVWITLLPALGVLILIPGEFLVPH